MRVAPTFLKRAHPSPPCVSGRSAQDDSRHFEPTGGPPIASALHYLGSLSYVGQLEYRQKNRWMVEMPKGPDDWAIAFVTSLDDLTSKSFSWLWFLIFGGALALCFCGLRARRQTQVDAR